MPNHPLLGDRVRLEHILDVMYLQIQRIMTPGRSPQSRGAVAAGRGVERILVGGESPDDVLQAALLALLSYDPVELTTTWEALAVTIARNHAIQAVRSATKGRLRPSDDGSTADQEVQVVSLSIDDEGGFAIDNVASNAEALEVEFVETRQQLILLRLARELLDDRERQIFFDIHYFGIHRAEVGRTLGLTGQRVGQIYRAVAERLLNAAHNDPTFRLISIFTERRTR